MAERKYQDVYALRQQNPGMSIAEAGRQLGYERELGDKGQGRVGPKHRGSDQARADAERIQRGDAPRSRPPSVPGMDLHHKRMIMLYKPLFEGLSKADALALSKHAAKQGLNLGDVNANYEYLDRPTHDKIHRYMERQGMRPSNMPDFSKADLANRKKAFNVLYRDFIQPDIDNQLRRLRMRQTVSGNAAGIMGTNSQNTQRRLNRKIRFGGLSDVLSPGFGSGSEIVDRVNARMDLISPYTADIIEFF